MGLARDILRVWGSPKVCAPKEYEEHIVHIHPTAHVGTYYNIHIYLCNIVYKDMYLCIHMYVCMYVCMYDEFFH